MARLPRNSVFFSGEHPLVRRGRSKIGYGRTKLVIDRRVTSWLFSVVKTGGWRREQRWKSADDGMGLLFIFKKPEHALMFKLTWGGNVG